MRRTEREHPGYDLEPGGKGVLFFLSLPLVFALLLVVAVSCDDPDRTAETGAAPTATEPSSQPRPLERVRLPEPEEEEEPSSAIPPESVDFATAEEAYRDGRFGDATTLLEAYLRDEPGDAWGHYLLGLAAWKSGQPDRAEEALREAGRIDAGHRKARVNVARVLLERGRVDEAREALDEALEIEPGAADALRVAGRVAEEEGRVDDAVEAYRRAILADPEDAWSMNNLGLIHIRRGLFEAAVPPLARAAELRDDVPVFRNNLGTALERTERYAAAADAYRAADSLGGGYAKARTSLARVEELEEARGSVGVDLASMAGEFTRTVEEWRAARTAEAASGSSTEEASVPRERPEQDSDTEPSRDTEREEPDGDTATDPEMPDETDGPASGEPGKNADDPRDSGEEEGLEAGESHGEDGAGGSDDPAGGPSPVAGTDTSTSF